MPRGPMRSGGGQWGFDLHGVRAGSEWGHFLERSPEIDAVLVSANERRFGNVYFEFVEAELCRVNQKPAIRVELDFIAAAV